MARIQFGIVGAGWRSEFFLRIVNACRDRFEVTGMVVRSEEKGLAFERKWGVKTFRTLDAMLEKTAPAFTVSSVSWDSNPGVLKQLAERRMPALSETPPAPDVERMTELYKAIVQLNGKVQVAEQVHLRPHHAAQLAVAKSGRLGTVSQAQLSVAHGYHGISVMRKFLGVLFDDATISGNDFKSPIVKGSNRKGPPEKEEVGVSAQQFFRFDFGDRLGLMDFTGDQYFAWIRNERLLVRGERGEIVDQKVYCLKDFRTPLQFDFVRHCAGINGDLQGNGLQGIQLGEDWVYKNPLAPASLMDDEVAIGACLLKMDEYVRTGRDFYSLAEGSQDHYLNLVSQQALAKGQPLKTQRQAWANG